MCSACGFPPALGHWTDAGGTNAHDRLRIRFVRTSLINALLKPLNLSVRDLAPQPGIQLSNEMGQKIICATIEDVWTQAESFRGAPFDPLDRR